jgi:hypothetical protein
MATVGKALQGLMKTSRLVLETRFWETVRCSQFRLTSAEKECSDDID